MESEGVGSVEVKKKLSKRGRMSRNKGKKFEQQVAARLRDIFPGARRHLEYHSEDANGYDLMSTGRLLIQCKAHAKYAPMTTIKEVQKREERDIPIVVTKADYAPVLVAMTFDDFIKVLTNPGLIFEGRESDMAPEVLGRWASGLEELADNYEPETLDMMR